MKTALKWVYFFLITIFVAGMISIIPIHHYRKVYKDQLNEVRFGPQRRVDATYRYVEAVESGYEDTSKGILPVPPRKYYFKNLKHKAKQPVEKPFDKPKYIRDEKNPKVLHPYNGKNYK